MDQRILGPISIDRIDRAAEILERALELETSEREGYLQIACNGDLPLRTHVDSLIAASAGAADFLASPTQIVGSSASPSNLAEFPSGLIGPYRLIRTLGEGGFGTVYLAEQEGPLRRQVALKVVKLGMDTRQVLARFAAERQALARMNHPCIARVYDAGATETGRPYFVMESVDGTPITTFCNEHGLSIRERLALFRKVCAGVLHAHQKGVIHRDLKPTNVLVAWVDGAPEPKVIDFGIAKATHAAPGEETSITQRYQVVGTPEYMAPEQTDPSGQGVDTRSDIYSLGVILYELLTGTTPFDRARLRYSTLDELRRILRETTPERPSARIRTQVIDRGRHTDESGNPLQGPNHEPQADALAKDSSAISLPSQPSATITEVSSAVSAGHPFGRSAPRRTAGSAMGLRCGVGFASLRRQLRGELDCVVMRALESNPSRRYESASALADDVERYLRGDRVAAVPPSSTYLLLKAIRRHKAPTAIVLMVTALFALLWASAESHNSALLVEKAKRKTHLGTSLQLIAAVDSFCRGMDPREVMRQPDALNGIDQIDRIAERIDEEFAGYAEEEAQFRSAVARLYVFISRHDDAREQAALAAAAGRNAFGDADPRYADLLERQAWVAGRVGESEAAAQLFEEALEIYRAINAAGDERGLQCMYELSRNLTKIGRLEQAADLRSETLHQLSHDHPNRFSILQGFAEDLQRLGRMSGSRSCFEEARVLFQEALPLVRRTGSTDQYTAHLHSFGGLLRDMGALTEAEAAFREALAIRRELVDRNHRDKYYFYATEESLGYTLALQRRFSEAEQLLLDAEKNYDPPPDRNLDEIRTEIVKRIVELYSRWSDVDPGKADLAKEWRDRLCESQSSERAP